MVAVGAAAALVVSATVATAQKVSKDDKKFVEKMLTANAAEIQLGQLGTERATNPEVKSFAQMMVTGPGGGTDAMVRTDSRGTTNPAVASYAGKTLPVVQQHLEQARQLEKALTK
jgi:predicted outer membrane protein